LGALSKGGTGGGDVIHQEHGLSCELACGHSKRAGHGLAATFNGDALDLDVIDSRDERVAFIAKAQRGVQCATELIR
jgi:hypothetical protein